MFMNERRKLKYSVESEKLGGFRLLNYLLVTLQA